MKSAAHPFQIITDHKHFEYRKSAKRLNPRQARWSLFFTLFQFTVTYRPGSKNIKSDTLSRQYSLSTDNVHPEPILPPSIVLAPVIWDIMDEIQKEQLSEPAPSNCPPGKQYVPQILCLRVMQWVHSSIGSGHPGIYRTLQLLQNTFWWPAMSQAVTGYVKSCQVCAQSKNPNELPSGLLQP